MTVTVNGKERTLEKEMTLQDFLYAEHYRPEQVAVEHNQVIVPQGEYGTVALRQGDVLEILAFMGGGSC